MTAEKKAQVRAAIWQSGYAGDEAKSELLGLLDAAEAEIERLRAKLEAAPHERFCLMGVSNYLGGNHPCDCWKADL